MRKRNLRKRKRRTQGTKGDIQKKKRGIIRRGKLKERKRRGRGRRSRRRRKRFRADVKEVSEILCLNKTVLFILWLGNQVRCLILQ